MESVGVSVFLPARNEWVNKAGECRTDDGSEPEQPELLDGPPTDKERGTGAAGGIHRKIRDGNADEMDERKPKADCDRGEALWSSLVRRAEDDHQEEKREHDFRNKRGDHRVFSRRVIAKSVGGKVADGDESSFVSGNEIENACTCDAAEHLGDDVGDRLRRGMSPADDEAYSDCGIEVAAGDVADGVGHSHYGEAEGQGDADKADAEVDWSRVRAEEMSGKHRAAAAAENEPEGAEELGYHFFC
jgi:hypothetical protein